MDVAYSRRHSEFDLFRFTERLTSVDVPPCGTPQFSSMYNIDTWRFFVGILDFLFPKRCVGCGRIGRYFCADCEGRLHVIGQHEDICPVCERPAIDGATHPRCRTRYGIDGLTSIFRYDTVARNAVKTLKYRLVFDLVNEFVTVIPTPQIEKVYAHIIYPNHTMLIPIPLHLSRLKFRGFNQAEKLGESVAKRLGLPMRIDILKRDVYTAPQVEVKSKVARLGNMKHVFHAVVTVRDRYIILFDDVFTTGATMRSATETLKRAGAAWVWAVTMAR